MDLVRLKVMLELQDSLNKKIDIDWRSKRFPWYRAIWVECAELIDHYGWKWWKKSSPDVAQIKLELVDIWHFGLSDLMQESSIDEAAREITRRIDVKHKKEEQNFLELVEKFSARTICEKSFRIEEFVELTECIGLTKDELHNTYVSKNILNRFRQENGYKDGTYIKIWDGREDNQVLEEIMMRADFSDRNYAELIYQELDKKYRLVRG